MQTASEAQLGKWGREEPELRSHGAAVQVRPGYYPGFGRGGSLLLVRPTWEENLRVDLFVCAKIGAVRGADPGGASMTSSQVSLPLRLRLAGPDL